ncbi:hypothetical protein SYJ56_19455 [Algoriphagus sp. D3-2-R+10]|uniref:hypothetical protein n=1 Tax=Algoriphagus aurantiacus TaxID=3103948 RepID=UPI002B39C7F0|nr:hypothetical protein [Algoriphagus sp. D3-2-R+10]MEB2777501.1 hypothetical protein [Algoriphagus sp. D3-2-R+10]
MDFKVRQEVISFLNDFEAKHPTEQWLAEGVKVWPILKTSLFLRLAWGDKGFHKQNFDRSELVDSVYRTAKRIRSSSWLKGVELKSANYLFFSGVNFREKFNGESFNKFYDPIGDELEGKGKKFIFLEYGSTAQENTYKNRVKNIQLIYHYFENRVKIAEIDYSKWNGIVELISFFQSRLSCSSLSVYEKIRDTLRKVFIWKASFDWILDQTKPQKIFLLSYYNFPCFGLLIAARRRGIACVDIQHGPQGVLHVAYSGFKEDYAILPTSFWLWDSKSEEQLKDNLNFSTFQTTVGGNPWHYFLMNKSNELNQKKPSILFTLQPVNPIIDEYVIDTILRTKDEYAWLIRLHPRIDTTSKGGLIEKLKILGIFDKGLWDLANETPLPLLLKEVDLHISKFSGCISEAADIGTFSIILEHVGEITFKHLLKEQIAIGGIDFNSENLLSAIHANIGKKKAVDSVDLELVVDQLC